MQQLTKADQDAFIADTNQKRREVEPPPRNMVDMHWDAELAQLAAGYASKCIYEHNKNRGKTGENLYIRFPEVGTGDVLLRANQGWYDEKKDFTYSDRSCKPGKMCGHYTQMVWAKTTAVGCAVVNCKNGAQGFSAAPSQMVVCNYSPQGNFVDYHTRKLYPPYEVY